MRYWIDSTAASLSNCAITNFAAPVPSSRNLSYVINDSMTSDIPAWTWTETPSTCDYTETLSFEPSLDGYPWISATDRTILVSTSDFALDGTS